MFHLLFPVSAYGVINKYVTLKVGDSFNVDPWSIANLTGYTAVSTSCVSSDNSALSVTETSRIKTSVAYSATSWSDGFYAKYKVKAIKTGEYVVTASALGYSWIKNPTSKSETIKYYVTVNALPVVTSITIPGSLQLSIGDTYTFKPVITEAGASTILTWTTSNSSVVSVTSSGVIKCLKAGQSTITCTATNGVSAQCVVTVSSILVNNIKLSQSELEIEIGERVKLIATVLPNNATNKSLVWSSSNENVAFVSGDGTIIGLSAGYCNIMATATDGSNKSASCLVHVIPALVVGDVDGNGVISIADVVEMIDLLLSGEADVNEVIDVDSDGRFSIADVTEMIDKLLNGN